MSGVISNTYVTEENEMDQLLSLDAEEALRRVDDLYLRELGVVSSVTILRSTLLKFLISKCEEKKKKGDGVEFELKEEKVVRVDARPEEVFVTTEGDGKEKAYDLVLGERRGATGSMTGSNVFRHTHNNNVLFWRRV